METVVHSSPSRTRPGSRLSLTGLLIPAAFIVLFAACAVFAHYMILMTEYRETALQINESFRAEGTLTLRQGEVSFSWPVSSAQYYDKFLSSDRTLVYSRRTVPEDEKTIVLDFGKERLSFTGLEDGSVIAVSWKTSSEEKHYLVRSDTSFIQLSSFFSNCRKKAGLP